MDERAAQPENFGVLVDSDLDIPVLIALLMRGEKILAAVFNPLHRAAQQTRRHRDVDVLGVERALGPEAAADIRRDHAHLVIAQLEHVKHAALQPMRAL